MQIGLSHVIYAGYDLVNKLIECWHHTYDNAFNKEIGDDNDWCTYKSYIKCTFEFFCSNL